MDLLTGVLHTFFTSPVFAVFALVAGGYALVRGVRFWRSAK